MTQYQEKEHNYNGETEQEVYNVEMILDKKKIDGVVKYLIKWEGYSHESNTWEPISNLEGVLEMVEEFEEKLKTSSSKAVNGNLGNKQKLSHNGGNNFTYSLEPGRFDIDIPKSVLTAKIVNSTDGNKEIQCLIEWHERSDGTQPNPSFFNNLYLRKKCPDLLLDFYESRLKTPKPNK